MAQQTNNKNIAYIALQNATRIGYANDDEVDDKQLAAATSGRYEDDEKTQDPEDTPVDETKDETKEETLPEIDVFCYPKHKNMETKELSESFWRNLATGECHFYDEMTTKDGEMFQDIKNWIEKYGANPEERVVLFISGKYADWLAALPTFANVFIILAGGGYNPKELTAEEMTEIATKSGSQPRFYIDHNHQLNLDVEAWNRSHKMNADKLPHFRNITRKELDKFGSSGWVAFMKIPQLADTLMDFIFTDNFSRAELDKVGTVSKFTDKLKTLRNFDIKHSDVEQARWVIEKMFNRLPVCTREDLQHKTPDGLRFQGAYCVAREVMRDLLWSLWTDGTWTSKFFSLRSGLGEELVNGDPNMVWGDCAIALSLSKKHQDKFKPSQRTFKRNEQGYVSAVKDENPVGNFYTLEFLPDEPLAVRAEMYGKISMEWWTNFMVKWAERTMASCD